MLSRKWIAAAVLAAGASSAAHAGFIETTFTSGMTTQLTSGVTTYNFDSGAKPAGYSGDGWVLPGSLSGIAAAPAGDDTPFLSVAFPKAAGIETFSAAPGELYNYFGLYWGSIDDYNWITFYNGDTQLATITGTDVIQSGTSLGDQVAAGSNRYVNFFLNDMWFDHIVFGTGNYAFESDNHAFGQVSVPEPGMLALLVAAMGGMFLMRRRRGVGAQ
ncbi:MAG: PEP-CTERM sorting domain-containing protein [Gammaproteobacteria bacterium]